MAINSLLDLILPPFFKYILKYKIVSTVILSLFCCVRGRVRVRERGFSTHTATTRSSFCRRKILLAKSTSKIDVFHCVLDCSHNIRWTSLEWLLFFPENLDQGCSYFHHSFWSSYDYLIHYQSEDSCAHYFGI